MESETVSLQEAVRNLRDIKRTIDRVRLSGPITASVGSLPFRLGVQLLAAGGALALIFADYIWHIGTASILYSKYDEAFRVNGLTNLAILLGLVVFVLAVLILCGARKEKEEFHAYLARNFKNVSGISCFSDLLIKFVILELIIAAPRPEWVAPLMVLFIADYLFQGRFFQLPTQFCLLAGITTLVIATGQFYYEGVSLAVPLTAFALLSAISAVNIIQSSRKQILQTKD